MLWLLIIEKNIKKIFHFRFHYKNRNKYQKYSKIQISQKTSVTRGIFRVPHELI